MPVLQTARVTGAGARVGVTGLMFPKGRPASLLREDRRKARASKDEQESATVKVRSKGQCEMVEKGGRCKRRAVHVHHLLGGNGARGRNASALAINKLHLCIGHHSDIHSHVLVPDGTTWRRIK